MLLLSLVTCKNNPGKTKVEKIDYLLHEAFEDKELIGNVLVADQGEIIYKKSFGRANQGIIYKIPTPPSFLLLLFQSRLQPFLY